jgi:diguanylate cyclase (GGDEF)-like protein
MKLESLIEFLQHFKILYVEDDADYINIMSQTLGNFSSNVITATHGQDGLQKFLEHSPDIVITDIEMPYMDGISMAQKIKELNKNVHIIVLSAYDDKSYLLDAINTGVSKYLLKPINQNILINSLYEIVLNIYIQQEHTVFNLCSQVLIECKGNKVIRVNQKFKDMFNIDDLDMEFFMLGNYIQELRGSNDYNSLLRLFNHKDIITTTNSKSLMLMTITHVFDTTFIVLKEANSIVLEKEKYKKLALKDSMTNVLNRFALEEYSKNIDFDNSNVAMIFFDVDDFKYINDTYGHQAGDDVLTHVADIVSMNIRKEDIFGRYGGDEFVIIVRESDDIYRFAQKLRTIIESEDFNGKNITISMGISHFELGDDIFSVLKKADKALYLAKNGGKNRVEII